MNEDRKFHSVKKDNLQRYVLSYKSVVGMIFCYKLAFAQAVISLFSSEFQASL